VHNTGKGILGDISGLVTDGADAVRVCVRDSGLGFRSTLVGCWRGALYDRLHLCSVVVGGMLCYDSRSDAGGWQNRGGSHLACMRWGRQRVDKFCSTTSSQVRCQSCFVALTAIASTYF
jgi:hypothetical protein